MEEKRNLRKERIGVITSSKMDKTVVVSVERKVKHPKYGKFVKFTKKFHAHDEANDCHAGDTVRIMECAGSCGEQRGVTASQIEFQVSAMSCRRRQQALTARRGFPRRWTNDAPRVSER